MIADEDGNLHDEESEKALLGAAFVEQDAIQIAADILSERDFYSPQNREIWSAMVALHKAGADVDSATLRSELERRKKWETCGGASYLDHLLDCRPIIPHADDYAKRIAECSRWRTTKDATRRLDRLLSDPMVSDEQVERALSDVRRHAEGSSDELPSLTLEELERLERPLGGKWLINGWWTAGGCGIIVGDPKSNKSLLSLLMCMSIASGADFLRRWPIAKCGPALYIGEEGDQWSVRDLCTKLRKACAIGPTDGRLVLSMQKGADITSQRGRGRISALVRRLRPVFTVIDTWGRCAERVDLNSYRDVMDHLGFLRRLSAETGTAIQIVHHLKKQDFGRAEHITARALGSQAFWGWSDDFIGVEKIIKGKNDTGERHVSAYHRAAGEMPKQSIKVLWDDDIDEVRLVVGDPPVEKGRASQQELADAF
jgi:hypothetical protein